MALTDTALWNRLMAFQYDRPEAGGLVDLVTQALGCTKREAQRRVEAYLRFVYLVAVSDEVLAPSKPVDEVWHLHLEDAATYRDAFCGAVVGRFINHHEGRPHPGKDPAYKRTLERYHEEFAKKPDAGLWPKPAKPVAKPLALIAAGAMGIAAAIVFALPLFAFIGVLLLVVGSVMLLERRIPKHERNDTGCGSVWSGSDGDSGCGGD